MSSIKIFSTHINENLEKETWKRKTWKRKTWGKTTKSVHKEKLVYRRTNPYRKDEKSGIKPDCLSHSFPGLLMSYTLEL